MYMDVLGEFSRKGIEVYSEFLRMMSYAELTGNL